MVKNDVIPKKRSVSDSITQKSTEDLLKKKMFNLNNLQKTSNSSHTKMCIASAIINSKFNTSSSHQTAYSHVQTNPTGPCPLMSIMQPSSSNGVKDNLAESMPTRSANPVRSDPANNLAAVNSFPKKLLVQLIHCPKKQQKWNSVLNLSKEKQILIYF